MKRLLVALLVLGLTGCGGGGGGGGSTPSATPNTSTSTPDDPVFAVSSSIADPFEYYSNACSDPSIQFVIPVNINDDDQSDFIVHYWCDANPYGSVVAGPTPDALVVQLSQPDGSYAVANEQVFGTDLIGLGGASRKFKRGDINGDGYDDFAFAMNYEDGRFNQDPNVCNAQPSVLMSTGPGTYEVVRLGLPAWGHGVSIVNNADGTVEVVFAGFVGEQIQAFQYANGTFNNVSHTYPADIATWANGVKAIDVNGVTEYIVGSWSNGTLQGAELYKRDGIGWTSVDVYGIPVAFDTGWTSWSNSYSTVSVYDIEGQLAFGATFESFDVLKGGLTGNGDDLIVGKLAYQALTNGNTIIEGVDYNENDTLPVNVFQFFEFSDAGLIPVASPIVNEEIDVSLNFYAPTDVNGDGYPDLAAYAFTMPWANSRVDEEGKPIVYLNDGAGSLVWTDLSDISGYGVPAGTQSVVDDVDNDGIVDIVLYGLQSTQETGSIVIRILNDYIK